METNENQLNEAGRHGGISFISQQTVGMIRRIKRIFTFHLIEAAAAVQVIYSKFSKTVFFCFVRGYLEIFCKRLAAWTESRRFFLFSYHHEDSLVDVYFLRRFLQYADSNRKNKNHWLSLFSNVESECFLLNEE